MIVRELRDEIKQVQLLKCFCCDSKFVFFISKQGRMKYNTSSKLCDSCTDLSAMMSATMGTRVIV